MREWECKGERALVLLTVAAMGRTPFPSSLLLVTTNQPTATAATDAMPALASIQIRATFSSGCRAEDHPRVIVRSFSSWLD